MKVSHITRTAGTGILFTCIIFLAIAGIATAQETDVRVSDTKPDSAGHHYFIRPLPELMGFATLGEGVTGGAGGQEVTVTTAEDLLRYATRDEPYIINVVDTIEIVRGIGNYRESSGEYHLGANTTLRGVGPNATILYGGFRIQEVENVIIQNLHFDGTFQGFIQGYEGMNCSSIPDGVHRYKNGGCLEPGDKGPTDNAFEITNGAERVWLTQNTFQRYSDEVMSIKRESSFITLSWNRYDDPVSGKDGMMILIGHSDDHVMDIGRLKTTIHHNVFGARDRQPRVRFGQVHIFNNYYHNPHGIFSYGAAAQRDSEVVLEGNYFENVQRPWRTDINNRPGYVNERNNVFDNVSNILPTRGSIGEEIFEPQEVYDYEMDDAEDIPEIVMASVGAGNWHFESGEIPVPSVVQHSFPEFGQELTDGEQFLWYPAILADSYEIQIATGSNFDNPDNIIFEEVLSDTSTAMPENLEPGGSYFWRVRAHNEKGSGAWSSTAIFSVEDDVVSSERADLQAPGIFALNGNYPNPFNPVTTISYSVPELAHVSITVFDILGRRVAVLLNQQQQAGMHNVHFDAQQQGLSSGIYLYRMVAQPVRGTASVQFVDNRTMMLIK